MRVFFCIFIKIFPCGSASPFGSLHFGKAVFLLPALSPSLPVSPDAHDFLPFCILYINYYNLFLLCYFCSGEDFSQYFLLFSYTFTYYRRFLESFLFRIKLAIQKGEFFCFFSSVVRKFLSISLFPLCPFFFSLRSPLLRRKSRELIFSLCSIFLSTAQKKTRISLSALPAAACVLRVFFCRIESFILAKSAEENSQHSRIFLFFRGKKTLFSQEFFSQFSRRKLAIYLLYIKR